MIGHKDDLQRGSLFCIYASICSSEDFLASCPSRLPAKLYPPVPHYYWHLLKISDLQTKKLVLLKAFDISMVLLTTLLSAIICDADWMLRQNLPVNSRQV